CAGPGGVRVGSGQAAGPAPSNGARLTGAGQASAPATTMANARATQRYRIVGSGPVALACALFMARAGIDAQRLVLRLPATGEARPADAPARPTDAAPRPGKAPQRMIAISDGSRQLLSRVMTMPDGGTIERIEVVLAGRSGRT